MKEKLRTKIVVKLILILLISAILLNYNPGIVIAFNMIRDKESETNKTDSIVQEKDIRESESKILGEDIQKRELDKKTFIMDDGTKMVTMYPTNVHYEKAGNLIDIDNSLVEQNAKIENKEGEYKVKYAKESDETKELATIIKDKYELKWNLVENEDNKEESEEISDNLENKILNNLEKKQKNKIKKVIAKIENNENIELYDSNNSTNKNYENQKITNLKNISSKIIYENIIENIDLSYQNTAQSVKESIVIKDKNAIQKEFIFKYYANDMIMELNEQNEILVYNSDKTDVIFKIEAPYMFDSALEQTNNIEVKLEKKAEYYIIKIKPNYEWLTKEERKYPVTIDPTINTSLDYNNIQDTFIFKGDGNTPNRHKAHIIRVGSNNRLKEAPRALIKFNLPELKSGDQVISAGLNICNYPDTEEWTPSQNEMQIDIHKMTSDWNETTACWNNCNDNYDKHITDYIKYKYDENDPFKPNYFDITAIVKEWYINGNNYGIMLKDYLETYNFPQSDAYFLSANTHSAFTQGRPMIQIIYRNQTGLENYMTYHTQNLGRAGEVNTNDYNGNVILSHHDVETPGNLLKANISHVYNTNNKDVDIGYGKGFRLNYAQQITIEKIKNIEYAKYIDEDGTEHYFKKQNDKIYLDEDGINRTLTLENNIFIMKDTQGNISKFKKINNKWNLYEFENTEKQKININVDQNEKILSVTDGSGNTLNISYSNGRLSHISDLSNRKIEYLYNSNGNLTQIKYFDGESSYYEYDNLNLLTKVKNVDGYSIIYDYYRQKVNRIKSVKEMGNKNTEGNVLDIYYGNNTTKFTNNNGYSNVYTFNNSGKTISIADFGKEYNNVNNAYGKMYEYGNKDIDKNKLTLESNLINIKEMPNNLIKNPYFDDELTYWEKQENADQNDFVKNADYNNKVYKTFGTAYSTKKLHQNIKVSGKKGDIYNLSYWVKSFGLQEKGTGGKSVRLTIGITRNDNSTQWIDSFVNTDTPEWQFMSKEIITDSDYKEIHIYLMNNNNANDTYWDNIGLFKDEKGNSYTYDKNGNIISSIDNANNQSNFKYSSEGNVAKSITPKGGSYLYEYDYNYKNRLLKAKNNIGQVYSYKYDEKGNVKNAKVEENDKAILPEENKIYNIKFANNNRVIDVRDSTHDNGGKIEQWEFAEGYKNKEFKFVRKDENYFKIIANHSNKAVDLDLETGKIQQWSERNSENQLWKAIDNGDGTIRIINKAKGDEYCLSLEKDDIENGNKIIISKWEGKSTQKLKIYDVNGNYPLVDESVIESEEVYRIKAKHSGMYLTVSGNENENSTAIKQQQYKNNDKKQLWKVIRQNDNTYKIINLASNEGKVIDIREGKNENNVQIQIYMNSENNVAQEWNLIQNDDSTFSIRTKMNGAERNIDIQGSSNEYDANAILYDAYNGDNQKFYFEKVDLMNIDAGATYKIKAKHSGKYIGADGGILKQQESNNEDSQKWKLKKLNNGYYKIVSKMDETKVVDIDNANTAEGTTVKIYDMWGEENLAQEFEFIPVGDGSFYIKPRLTKGKRCLDVENGSKNNGVKIWSWSVNNSEAQQFFLEIVEPSEKKKYIETEGKYSEDGRYLISETDQIGNETNYEYDYQKGLLTKEIENSGGEIRYEYDKNNDNLTKISQIIDEKEYSNSYIYENDYIKEIISNGAKYQYIYDEYGNVQDIKVGNQSLKQTNYATKNGNILNTKYGNNQNIKYEYDRFNRLIKKEKTTGNVEFIYDAKSNLKTVKDNTTEITQNYKYDLSNRIISVENSKGLTILYDYDDNSNVSKIEYKINGTNNNVNYNYDSNNLINNIAFKDSYFKINYDRLARITSQEINNEKGKYVIEYKYKDIQDKNRTTTILESIKNGENESINYTYNSMGYIETIKEGNNLLAKYYYDKLGQVIREDNKEHKKTTTYNYDLNGNILNKKEYEYTEADITTQPIKIIEYIYNNANWKDQLTSYNGKEIKYDEIGNPILYDGNIYKWQNGRELASIQNEQKKLDVKYKYSDDGIRTEKIVNGIVTNYYLEDDLVIYEIQGDDILYYQYDNSGNVIGFINNNNQYYYLKNGQNDIIGILDSNLKQIASYSYDIWGNLLNIKDGNGKDITNEKSHIGYKNPYRYRSYRYDPETKLYYLQNRYYNPEMGRFLSQDIVISTEQGIFEHNMYVYCNNNPINMCDQDGRFATLVAGGLGGILGKAIIAAIGAGITTWAVSATATTVSKASAKTSTKANKNTRRHTVYKLVDKAPKKKDDIKYIGRTVNFDATKIRHKSNPYRTDLEAEKIADNLNWYEARALEQHCINKYKTLNKSNKMYNQINGLRKDYWNNLEFKEVVEYGLKALSNESLTYVGE